MCIGFTIITAASAVGHISGALMNPAVTFGLRLAHATGGGSFWEVFPYIAIQVVAAVVAVGFFRVSHYEMEYKKVNATDSPDVDGEAAEAEAAEGDHVATRKVPEPSSPCTSRPAAPWNSSPLMPSHDPPRPSHG